MGRFGEHALAILSEIVEIGAQMGKLKVPESWSCFTQGFHSRPTPRSISGRHTQADVQEREARPRSSTRRSMGR